ncbi:acetylornithine deacetylase [Streptosporangium violaceochromogenes]|nr:acetylornithine deacetylase [Streptosporangium violaceochromogenes]
MPAGDGWGGDPFRLSRAGDRLEGRGVCDAKGQLAAMARALVRLAARPRLGGEVVLVAVGGEEAGATGAKALVEEGFTADAVVVGEPTGMRVCTAHKGRAEVTVRVTGTGGHAAAVRDLDPPVARLPEVLLRLERLAAELAAAPHPVVGPPTLAVTRVSARAANTATVPQEATLVLDRRLVPGETHERVDAEIRRALDGLAGVEVRTRAGAHPAEQDPGHPLVRAARAATGSDASGGIGFPATCDQYVFARTGAACVVLGAGDLRENRAHAAGEHVSLEALAEASAAYERLALTYLAGLAGLAGPPPAETPRGGTPSSATPWTAPAPAGTAPDTAQETQRTWT